VLGVLFLAQAATRDILIDRESGLLRQLLTAPVTVGDYLTGKCLTVLTVTAGGLLLMLAAGAVAGVTWRSPVTVVCMSAATAVAVSGLLLALYALVRTERQGDTLSTIVIMVCSILGGVFVPVSQMPGFLLPFARLTPTYWATEGLRAGFQPGGGVAAAAPHIAALVAIGLGLLTLGVVLLQRRIARGGV
jgi:ABC-2 type transport system permease protein